MERGSTPMQGTSSWTMDRGRTWSWSQGLSLRAVRGSVAPSARPARFDDAVIALCFLALVGVVVFGGLLMLFSWVTTGLPSTAQGTCPAVEACVAPPLTEDPAQSVTASVSGEPAETP